MVSIKHSVLISVLDRILQKTFIKQFGLFHVLKVSVHENLGNLKRLSIGLVYLNFNPENPKRPGLIIETIENTLQREIKPHRD